MICIGIFVDSDLQCTTWPNSSNYGCNSEKGGDWKHLNNATFGTAECESLCLHHASREGCCLVDDFDGCYWRHEATVSNKPYDRSLAVTCNYAPKSEFSLNLCTLSKVLQIQDCKNNLWKIYLRSTFLN